LIVLVWVLLLATVSTAGAAHAKRAPRPNEPFQTFRAMDARLSAVDVELTRAQQVAERTHQKKDWIEAARKARAAAISVDTLARRLRLRYRGPHRPLANRLFRPLERSSALTARDIGRALTAKNPGAASRALRAASQERLAMVLHYQAVSGGYAALRCNPGQWACCEPKRLEDPEPGVHAACSWRCTGTLAACHSGLPGPRSSEPLEVGSR
jgi:hypothetical protein